MRSSPNRVKVFVYGSLKKGFAYHQEYCDGALSLLPAVVRGILFRHPSGFPVVEVPGGDILAEGTTNPTADAAVQADIRSGRPAAGAARRGALHPYGPWRLVRGELLTFPNPRDILPALDDLEDFHPGEATLYRRVLLPARAEDGTVEPAWTYVLGASAQELTLYPGDSWTPEA